MGSRETGRRRFLRSAGALASVGAASGLSGCFGLFGGNKDSGDDDGVDENSPARHVPKRAKMVTEIDAQAVLNDDAIRASIDDALARGRSAESEKPQTVSAAFDALESRYGLPPEQLTRGIVFTDENVGVFTKKKPSGDEYWGIIGFTDWSGDAMQTSYQNVTTDSVSETTHEGTAVYTTEKDALAVLGDGTVVYGNEQAVTETLEVDAGNRGAVSGRVRESFDSTSGKFARFATTLDVSTLASEFGMPGFARAYEQATTEYIHGSVFSDGGEYGFRATVKMGTISDAQRVTDMVASLSAVVRGQGFDDPTLQSFEQAAKNVEAERDGKVSTIEYRAPPSTFATPAGETVAVLLRAIA